MLEAGEDPLYIMRRLIRFASEDVGMADPQALVVAMAAQQAVHFVGMPECNLALAQTVVYLATAPKATRFIRRIPMFSRMLSAREMSLSPCTCAMRRRA